MNPGEPFSKDGNSCGVQSLISLVQVKAEILFKSSEKEGTGAEQTKTDISIKSMQVNIQVKL